MPQIVHVIADLGARRSQRKARSLASSSTTNLLSRQEQHSAHSVQQQRPADLAPAMQAMGKDAQQRQRVGAAAAAGADVEAPEAGCSCKAGQQQGADGSMSAAAPAAAADAASCDDGNSVSTHLADLGPLPEPCDSVTGAVVAATSPEVVQESGEAEPSAQVGFSGLGKIVLQPQ